MKEKTGVVVNIHHDGRPAYIFGLIRKEDEKEFMRQMKAETSQSSEEDTFTVPREENQDALPTAYPAPVIESLTMHKTAAIAAELAQQPGIALAAIVHALVLRQFELF